jgi:hypothetical protein
VRRTIAVVLSSGAVALALSGCVLLPFFPQPRPPQETPFAPDGPVTDAPAGWTDLEPCDPSDRWIWVEGYPAAEMEAAGLEAECGGTYFDPGSPTYVSAGDNTVTREQLDALRAALEAEGYTVSDSTFHEPKPGDQPGLAGSWKYDRGTGADAETIYLVNFWRGGDPIVYQTFLDYESPATHALQK